MRVTKRLDAEGLYQKAVRTLAQRGRTELELRRQLGRVAAEAGDVDGVVARLREHGYLDDGRLAEHAAAFHKEAQRHGRQRALRDLRGRGIAAGAAAGAVEAAYGPDRPEAEDKQLRAYLEKKRLKRPEDARQAASLCRKLLLAGFSAGACQRALRRWQAEPEWLEIVEAIEMEGE